MSGIQKPVYLQSVDEVVVRYSSSLGGLSSQEARKRLMEQSWQGMVDADGAAVRKAIEEQLGPTPEPMLKE